MISFLAIGMSLYLHMAMTSHCEYLKNGPPNGLVIQAPDRALPRICEHGPLTKRKHKG